MSYAVIVDWATDEEGDIRVAKLQSFQAEAEAEAHVEAVRERYPNAFVVAAPPEPTGFWLVDPAKRRVSIKRPKEPVPEPDPVMVALRALRNKAGVVIEAGDLDQAKAELIAEGRARR